MVFTLLALLVAYVGSVIHSHSLATLNVPIVVSPATGIPKQLARARVDLEGVKKLLNIYVTQESGESLIPLDLFMRIQNSTSDECFPATDSYLYPEALCAIFNDDSWGQSSKYLVWVVERFMHQIHLVIYQDHSIIDSATEISRLLRLEERNIEPYFIKDIEGVLADIYPDEARESLLNKIRERLRRCINSYRSSLKFWQRVLKSTKLILSSATKLETLTNDLGAKDKTVESRARNIKKELSVLSVEYTSIKWGPSPIERN